MASVTCKFRRRAVRGPFGGQWQGVVLCRCRHRAELSLWQVPVEVSGATWNAVAPTNLFSGHYVSAGTAGRTYDVSPDGQQFLMIKAPGTDKGLAPAALIVVQHWDEELKRLVPTK